MSKLTVIVDDQPYDLDVTLTPACNEQCRVTVNGAEVDVIIPATGETYPDVEWMIINGRPYELTADNDLRWLQVYDGIHSIEIQDREAGTVRPRSGDGRIKAPIPGLVTRILVSIGDTVRVNQPIIVLEAMKMENEIRAPFEGTVTALAVSAGETVLRNAILAEIG